MIYKFIYSDVISNVRDVCHRHLENGATINDLQGAVSNCETINVAYEERDIRDFFTGIESKIELVKFTINEDCQFDETKKIALSILGWLEVREHKNRD